MQSIKRNYFFTLIKIGIVALAPMVTYPYVSRVLGPSNIGDINFAWSFASVFVMIASVGIPLYAVREIPRIRDLQSSVSNLVSILFSIVCTVSIIVFILYQVVCLYIPAFSNREIYLLITGANIIVLSLNIEWYFQAMEKFEYIAVRTSVFQIFSIILIFLFIKKSSDAQLYLFFLVLPSVFSCVYNQYIANREVKIRFTLKWNLLSFVRPILAMFLISAVGSLYQNLNAVLLGLFSKSSSVGYFATSLKLESFLQNVIGSLALILSPRMAYFIAKGKNVEHENHVLKSIQLVFVLCIPLCIGTIFFSREIILLFAGEAYTNSIYLLRILAINILLVSLSNILGYMVLIPSNHELVVLKAIILGFIVCIFISLILIPRYAEYGSAISSVLAEVSVFLYLFFHCRWIMGKIQILPILKYFISGMLVALLIYIVKIIIINIFLRIFIGAGLGLVLYVGCIYLLRDKLMVDFILGLKLLRARKNRNVI